MASAMSAQQTTFGEREHMRETGKGKEVDCDQADSTFLPVTTTPREAASSDGKNENAKESETDSYADESRKDRDGEDSGPSPPPANAGLPSPPMKPKPTDDRVARMSKGAGHDRTASTSSIWTSAATTLKNLVIGKPQPPSKDIVAVVPDLKIARERVQSAIPQSVQAKLDEGKGKVAASEGNGRLPPAENILPVLDPPGRPQSYDSKFKAETRPSAPPSRLSSIAHSLPTTSSHPPASSQQSTTAPSSIQSPNSTTSNGTATSATTATDEENQAAALAALNAVIHSVGTGYTQPLTSRAAQLHANGVTLAQQREKLLHTSALLAKDTAALQKLALESNNKLKGFGDLQNWSDTLDNDLSAIEETLKLVERGSLDVCSKCEGPIEEEEEQRWCGECGKGFHAACPGHDSEPPGEEYHRGPPVGEDYEEPSDGQDRAHEAARPENIALPSSLPSASTAQQTSADLEAMSSLFSAFSPAATAPQHSVPSVPKPSSMFEWGGIPDSVRLEDEEHSGSESWSGSDWSNEHWRCRECRLKDDLAAIGREL